MHVDDQARVLALNRFTMEKAKLVTNGKVFFTVEPYWEKGPSGGLVGAELIYCMKTEFGKESVGIETWHLVRMARWYFDIFKHDIELVRKLICHELAHIPVPRDHNEDFKRYAELLGAGEFSNGEMRVLRTNSQLMVKIVLAMGRGCTLISKRLRK
jgi:hypothetical protein